MAKKSGAGQNMYVAGYDLSGDVGALNHVRASRASGRGPRCRRVRRSGVGWGRRPVGGLARLSRKTPSNAIERSDFSPTLPPEGRLSILSRLERGILRHLCPRPPASGRVLRL